MKKKKLSDEVAFAPAGVNHEDNKYRHQNGKTIEKQVWNIRRINNKVHVDTLSSRNDAHQQIIVAINPNGNTPEGGLSIIPPAAGSNPG